MTVVEKGGKPKPGKDAVVWIPGSSRPAASPARKQSRIASKGKRFDPRVTVVPVGSAVEFPNYDRIFHNVFSLSETAPFDLGLYRNGASKNLTFERPGLVRIYCNIHPHMAAYLLVVDGWTYARCGADGVALLSGLQEGKHPLKVWDEKGGEWSGSAEVHSATTTPVEVVLDASGFKEVSHKNKHGEDYPPPDDDENRY